jgi:DNA invertase Pin-like site-specific DNA recombinase
MKRAAIYAYSATNLKQPSGLSHLAEQIHLCREYAKGKRYEIRIPDIYQDHGKGKREALSQAVDAAKHGDFDVLLVTRLDRFGRARGKRIQAIKSLHQTGVHIETVTNEPFDNLILLINEE